MHVWKEVQRAFYLSIQQRIFDGIGASFIPKCLGVHFSKRLRFCILEATQCNSSLLYQLQKFASMPTRESPTDVKKIIHTNDMPFFPYTSAAKSMTTL
jgi:hypothetical protein